MKKQFLASLDKFQTSDGIAYRKNKYGGIKQMHPERYTYDASYNSTYDTEEYRQASRRLQEIRWQYMTEQLGVPSSIIDIGFGNGSFLDHAVGEMGPDATVHGFDIASGYDGTGRGWQKVDSYRTRHYDVACFFDSLEHMHHLDILKEIDATVIAVSLPYLPVHEVTIEEFDVWHHRKPDEHIWHFDMTALSTLMRSYGYRHAIRMGWPEDEIRRPRDKWGHNILSGIFARSV